MTADSSRPVLLAGGYGVVGRETARLLRAMHPDLPIAIAGRDLAKAADVANAIGHAGAYEIDLTRPDLGLPAGSSFGAVVAFLKDDTLNTMRVALASGIPYVAFSDFAFDIGPEIALFAHHPTRAPILVLGHFLGGTVTMAALELAQSFRTVSAIEISAVFDAEDLGGGAAQKDMERLAASVPRPLMRIDGKWVWASGDAAKRRFTGVDGTVWDGEAIALLDTPSLAAATGAQTVRVDFAVGPPAGRRADGRLSHEVVIEITGILDSGAAGRARYDLVDHEGYSAMSARGAALAIERLLGLAGGPPPAPGLYHPETLLDPGAVVARMKAFGTKFTRSFTPAG